MQLSRSAARRRRRGQLPLCGLLLLRRRGPSERQSSHYEPGNSARFGSEPFAVPSSPTFPIDRLRDDILVQYGSVTRPGNAQVYNICVMGLLNPVCLLLLRLPSVFRSARVLLLQLWPAAAADGPRTLALPGKGATLRERGTHERPNAAYFEKISVHSSILPE